MKKPNFFLIGAPRCGTTSLASWLSEHSEIYFSSLKEPHYFDNNNTHYRPICELEEYEALFNDITDKHTAVGEGSTNYLNSQVAVKNILDYNPHARFIVCLREPISAARSMHQYRCAALTQEHDDFEIAWAKQEQASIDGPIDSQTPPSYRALYSYAIQLENLYAHAKRENILIVFSDDLRNNPKSEYERVLNFLNVTLDNRTTFTNKHKAASLKSSSLYKTLRLLSRAKKKMGLNMNLKIHKHFARLNHVTLEKQESLSTEFQDKLNRYFNEDIERLETLLDKDLSHWKHQEVNELS